MSEDRLSLTQRLAFAFSSEARRAEMMEQSLLWMVACPCGAEFSVWDLGGVRYRARGTKRVLRRCLECGRLRWHKVYFAAPKEPPPPPKAQEQLQERLRRLEEERA